MEIRGKYTDGSNMTWESGRTAADYFKGSRNDFYTLLPSDKTPMQTLIGIDNHNPTGEYVEVCSVVPSMFAAN